MQRYPTHSDHHSLAIKFNILRLSKFRLLSFEIFGRDLGHKRMAVYAFISLVSFLLYCAGNVNVNVEDVL